MNMPLRKVALLSQLPAESVREVVVGETVIALCRCEGELAALDGICPHHGGPLGQGNLEGGHVICPWHMWEFDCRTGAFDRNPDVKVAVYPVVVEGDDILVDLPEPHA